MLKKMKLGPKLMIIGVALTVVPLVILGVSAYLQNRTAIEVSQTESIKLAYTDRRNPSRRFWKSRCCTR